MTSLNANFDPENDSHSRYNPLLNEWILVSPHRTKRPWNGEQAEPQRFTDLPEFIPGNGLCPGNMRSSGKQTPVYTSTHVFENDFPALIPQTDLEKSKNTWHNEDSTNDSIFFKSKKATGVCKVMCFHPKSNVTLPVMTIAEIRAIVDAWTNEAQFLSQSYCYVQVFENKGAMMGCSNPHPHCQIWASNYYPNLIQRKMENFRKYFGQNNSPMLYDYAMKEVGSERVVVETDSWLVVVPYWALWPYETLVIFKGRKNVGSLHDLKDTEKQDLAIVIKKLTTKYDNLFKCSFPYSMGFQLEPDCEQKSTLGWQLHAHFYPPLLRSASVKKHMVGYELLAQCGRDIPAEKAAQTLKELSDIHYTTE